MSSKYNRNMIDSAKISQLLSEIGFTDKEARVYLVILELNEALPSSIGRKAGVKRSTAYVILERLQKKGLISSVIRNGSLHFRAVDPQIFLNDQLEHYKQLEENIGHLSSILPDVMNIHHLFNAGTPQMSVFKGKDGLIQVMEDSLSASTELLCWCDVELATNTLLKDYFPKYLEGKMKRNIWLKGIFCKDKASLRHKKYQKEELREVYLIPKEKFPFDNEINIYDDKVSVISHEDAVGVIIQNEHIANTQRSIFNFAFEYAKIIEKEILTDEDKAYLYGDKNQNNEGLVRPEQNEWTKDYYKDHKQNVPPIL
jgi:sugar-specific transcriptional regulator TrmB